MGSNADIYFLWQHEYNSKWITYTTKNLDALNKAFSKGRKTVTLPGKDEKTELVIIFDQMVQKNKVSGYEQPIRCCVFDGTFYAWLWQDEHNYWNSYIPGVCLELESALKTNTDVVKFYFKDDYQVDIGAMKQKNLSTSTERSVKREKIEVTMSAALKNIAEVFTIGFKVMCSNNQVDADTKSPSVKPSKISEKKNGGQTKKTEQVKGQKEKKLSEQSKAKKVATSFCETAVPVDPVCHLMNAHVYCDETGNYDAMLNQTNLQQNNNKFYRLQLLKENKNNLYYVWLHWGRVGKKGQNNLVPFRSNLDAAKLEFASKFKDKTKNLWEERCEFEKHAGKYDLVHVDYSTTTNEVIAKPAVIVQKPSILHQKILYLMEMISNMDEVNQKIIEQKYDINKCPLGKLSTEQINAGYEALKEIEKALTSSSRTADLIDACSAFYTRIPHDFGMKTPPLINSLVKLKEKIYMLEALSDIQTNVEIKNERNEEVEHPADFLYKRLECSIKVLDSDDETYKMIENYMGQTHGPTHSLYSLKVVTIYECRREVEYAQFTDIGNKHMLWHGSRLTNFVGILKNGLKIAPKEAPVTGYMFGKGLYFADISSKSANYCYPSKANNDGLLLLCEVSLGKQDVLYNANYDAQAAMCLHKKESVKGVGKLIPDPQDIFEFGDAKMLIGKPVDNTEDGDKCTLNYNEYIVYNPRQVKIRYILHVKFLYRS